MNETRTIYGHPYLEPEEPETWDEELCQQEREALSIIRSAVARALRGYLSELDSKSCAEEALWYVSRTLRQTGKVVLPGIGTLELVRDQRGLVTQLQAIPSPSLTEAP